MRKLVLTEQIRSDKVVVETEPVVGKSVRDPEADPVPDMLTERLVGILSED